MEELAQVPPPPTTDQILRKVLPHIEKVMLGECEGSWDQNRVYALQMAFKCHLYNHGLQNYAPVLINGLASRAGVSGVEIPDDDEGDSDYNQNIYRGFARKFIALLGNRMPNVVCVPDNSESPEDVQAAETGQVASLSVRETCELEEEQYMMLLTFQNAGTVYLRGHWVVDSDRFGYKKVQTASSSEGELGDESYVCPNCQASVPSEGEEPPTTCNVCGGSITDQDKKPPTSGINLPQITEKEVEAGGLIASIHDCLEVSHSFNAKTGRDLNWLRYDSEKPKADMLKEWGRDKLLPKNKANVMRSDLGGTSASYLYAKSIRSALASPIGIIQNQEVGDWTRSMLFWKPKQYLLIEDDEARNLLTQMFPKGFAVTVVNEIPVDISAAVLDQEWTAVKPEPSARLNSDPLGMDWLEATDVNDSLVNMGYDTLARSSQPGYVDADRADSIDVALRRNYPGERVPIERPVGTSLGELFYDPTPKEFSAQLGPFKGDYIEVTKQIVGMTDAVWGGGTNDAPTARQDEMKKNAAIMQLSTNWKAVGKAWEKFYRKACRIIAEREEGVIRISKKTSYGRYATLAANVENLRNGNFHFEAEEAIPMTWGQRRDNFMWFLDKDEKILDRFGFNDPLNIADQRQLLGIPGERVPYEDEMKSAMIVIDNLLGSKPIPGEVDPNTGQPGPNQSSVQPNWEDDHDFCSRLAKSYMKANPEIEQEVPDGWENLRLWGQAQEAAIPPAPPPAPKISMSYGIKGDQTSPEAVDSALKKSNLIDSDVNSAPPPPPPQMDQNGAPQPQTPVM